MRGPHLVLIGLSVFFLLATSCHYDVELHRRTVTRADFDTACAHGHAPWRMFYEGTDSAHHRFLVNDMDMWRHVRIRKEEIQMQPEVAAGDTSAKGYWMNPCKGWGESGMWLHKGE